MWVGWHDVCMRGASRVLAGWVLDACVVPGLDVVPVSPALADNGLGARAGQRATTWRAGMVALSFLEAGAERWG